MRMVVPRRVTAVGPRTRRMVGTMNSFLKERDCRPADNREQRRGKEIYKCRLWWRVMNA